MVEQVVQHRRAVDLPLRAQNAQSVDPRQHVQMAEHRMIFRPLVEITEQEDAVGLAVDDRLQQAGNAKTPGDRHRVGAAAHAAPDLRMIARPVADAPFAGGITPFAHRADVDMNGDEFDRLARDLILHRAEPRGIAVDADDPPHLPRRDQRGFAATEFEQRSQPRKLQLDLRDFRRGQIWSHSPLPHCSSDMGGGAPRPAR